jgi:hypothetical protein
MRVQVARMWLTGSCPGPTPPIATVAVVVIRCMTQIVLLVRGKAEEQQQGSQQYNNTHSQQRQ